MLRIVMLFVLGLASSHGYCLADVTGPYLSTCFVMSGQDKYKVVEPEKIDGVRSYKGCPLKLVVNGTDIADLTNLVDPGKAGGIGCVYNVSNWFADRHQTLGCHLR